MKNQRTEEIIRAYLSGNHSPEGEALFNEWYASFPNEETLNMDDSDKEVLRQKMLRAISKNNLRASLPPSATTKPLLPRRNATLYYRIAASLVGVLILTSVAWWYYQSTPPFTSLTTGDTEIRKITLADGSEVMLNANSELRYHPNWDEETDRHVWLEGEAFFSVEHTQNHQAFVVHTSGLEVKVLGTKFNVRHRRDQTAVVLNEGKVRAYVPSSSEQVTMQPGEQVLLAHGQESLIRRRVNTKQYTAWKNQELILKNTSLQEIAAMLEDYYGFEVVLANDALGKLRVSSTNALSLKNVDVLLAAISEIFSLKATRTQKRIYLEK